MNTTSKRSISQRLLDKKRNKEHILSIYLTLGYPDLDTSIETMIRSVEAGADIVEIGLPFSDPMADGPIIQKANQYVLNRGFDIISALTEVLLKLQYLDTSVVIMTYANIFYNLKSEILKFYNNNLFDGIIIPDLPIEYLDEYNNLLPIFLVAPNTSIDRFMKIGKISQGFVYMISKLGITGGEYITDDRLKRIYHELKQEYPELPLLQGFGINSSTAVDGAIQSGADGVIIGSKLIQLLDTDGNVEAVETFIKQIRTHLDQIQKYKR